MYEATIQDRVSHHPRLSGAMTAILIDLFEHRPELASLDALASLTGEERKTLIGGNLTHNGHALTGCDLCTTDAKGTYQPFGKDQ